MDWVFEPDENDAHTLDVPYLDEARAADGWKGISTTLSYDRLKSEVVSAIARLGGIVHGFQRGTYRIGDVERAGCIIHYSIEGPGGQMVYGRIDIAALPVKEPSRRHNWQEVLRRRHEQSLRVALYNVARVLEGQWVLKQLNPTYVPLIPWMLASGKKTLNELWLEAGMTPQLAPPKTDFIEGEYSEEDE